MKNLKLLQEIIGLWVTMRGFTIAGCWLENYKRATKTSQKELTLFIIYIILFYNVSFFEYLVFFGNGTAMSVIVDKSCFLSQFPRTGSSTAEPCTLNDTVLSQNCFTVGLSDLPPHALCLPKKDSTGSWHNFSEKKHVTPGRLRSWGVISVNEATT